MLKKRAALGIVAASFLFLGVDWLTSVQIPVPCGQRNIECHEYAEIKQCTTLRSTVFEGAAPFVYRAGNWLEAHNGAITGVATVFIGLFTCTLYLATTQQARITNDALRLATKEFTASHRPRLGIREPRVMWAMGENSTTIINYVLENYGETGAHIIEAVLGDVFIEGGAPDLPNFDRLRKDIQEDYLAPGVSIRLTFNSTRQRGERDMHANERTIILLEGSLLEMISE
jgi:hypothetical protein